MYSMRHPVLPVIEVEGQEQSDQASAHGSVTSLPGSLGVAPNPSLPGLAFAACAAALPLMQLRDIARGEVVVSLFKTAMSVLVEPKVASQSEFDPNDLGDTDRGRIQHLLNRFEQVSSC
jgi:hypothetical protein